MIISDERFAAGLVDLDGHGQLFDDPGEMIVVIQDEGLQGRRPWVHDFESMSWIDARNAHYVVTFEYPTPMGTGVIPFLERADADDFADEKDGTVWSWDQMLNDWSFGERLGSR